MLETTATATDDTAPDHDPLVRVDPSTDLAACLLGVAAAWLAADAFGLLAYPLRASLTWVALLFAATLTGFGRSGSRVLVALGVGAGVLCTASSLAPVRVAGVAVVLLSLAADRGTIRLRAAGQATVVLALFKLTMQAVPTVWFAVDRACASLGQRIGEYVGTPLSVGPSFFGIDLLVLCGALGLAFFRHTRGIWQTVPAAAVVLGLHFGYLALLAAAPRIGIPIDDAHAIPLGALLGGALPPAVWSVVADTWPWNAPALGALLQLCGAVFWLAPRAQPAERKVNRKPVWSALAFGLACVVPLLGTISVGGHQGLQGKRILAFKKCYGNWERPQHGEYGRLSIGMYGMFEQFVRLHGAEFTCSEELTSQELSGADVLLLIYPHKPWLPDQLQRIRDYVSNGGSLLVLGEHSTIEDDGAVRFNEALEGTGMQVAFDSATFAVGGWLQSYEPGFHPSVVGVDLQRNRYGVVIGASMEIDGNCTPLLLGKWGFNDPGDRANKPSMMGNDRYDAGERLGDVILAAETRFGRGRIIAFGDTSTLTNGITMGAHPFSTRLLGYLANRPNSPHAAVRQILTLLGTLLLLGVLLARHAFPTTWLWSVLLLAAATTAGVRVEERLGAVLPDGRGAAPNRLAYVDTSHLGRFSAESWRVSGTMGLRMMLMRAGYLSLELPEFSRARLERAGLLVTIAPARAYSTREVDAIEEFVHGGGVLLCCCGYPDRAGCAELLDRFGFAIGRIDAAPGREPQPMGHFKVPFLRSGNQAAYVRFDEAWPVACTARDAPPSGWATSDSPDERTIGRLASWLRSGALAGAFPSVAPSRPSRVLAYGMEHQPVIAARRVGRGSVVVVADTGFGHDVNTERTDGKPIEGQRENAEFWQWLLAELSGAPTYLPAALRAPAPKSGGTTEEKSK
ncbi:MAG: hypothetical protein KDC87_03610 [Planctomycetes bacterium]|nr:hypothetical protein [Planctomycetota bacterium]MCB9870768.1 hypothetical protein [Planctomycetota bacterium]